MDKLDEFFDTLTLLNRSLHKYQINKEKISSQLQFLTQFQQQSLDQLVLRIKDIYTNIDTVNQKIEDLQHEIDINQIQQSNREEIERIREYDNNKELENFLFPYFLIYSIYK